MVTVWWLKSTFPVTIQSPFSHHSVTIQSTERWDFILCFLWKAQIAAKSNPYPYFNRVNPSPKKKSYSFSLVKHWNFTQNYIIETIPFYRYLHRLHYYQTEHYKCMYHKKTCWIYHLIMSISISVRNRLISHINIDAYLDASIYHKSTFRISYLKVVILLQGSLKIIFRNSIQDFLVQLLFQSKNLHFSVTHFFD